ncbi:Nicotinamide riboside transporter PnuC [Serratia symbiotica]|nr:Nicotinamide riboside transporter PnuC [Serratia symbiotica]
MSFFSTGNILVHINLGVGGYDLSWIEAVGTLFGLLCIWGASKEKSLNYLFGLINVTLFSVIFFQIQLYASLLLQLFFFGANLYGWYAWSRQTHNHQGMTLRIRWLSLPKSLIWASVGITGIPLIAFNIDRIFSWLTQIAISIIKGLGITVQISDLEPNSFPFWDSAMMMLSIVAMILMTNKYVETWLLWIVIDVISVVIFAYRGVYVMALEYIILTLIAIHGSCLWIKSAKANNACALSSAK